MKVQRFGLSDGKMVKDKCGEWVRYADVYGEEQPTLFEESQMPVQKNRSPYQQFVDLHFELHPCKPIFGKTEGAIVKQILKDQDLEVALSKLRRYYKGDLWFTQDKQFSLKGFRAHYNEIPVNGNGYHPSGVGHGRFSEASWERIKNLMPSGGARGSV